jgi:DNA-binding NarL/FixJ family response regulator
VIRALVSARSPLVRRGLAGALRGDERIAVVGETAPAELSDAVAAFAPDVLVEERNSVADGFALPSVVLSEDARRAWLEVADAAGERGPLAILAREASPEEIVAAVVAVSAGLVAVQPRTLAFSRALADPIERNEPLSPRERGVLAEMARGSPNKEIAARLGISEHTVKFHVGSIFAKLGVSSRTEAVTQGMRLGLVML